MNNLLPNQFFNRTEIEILEAEAVISWGKTLVIAPHPDDESLGCGGAIALLRKYECEVAVLTVSDGTLSHPNSKKYPAPKLRELREREMIAALDILGVSEQDVTFLRLKDRNVPGESADGFTAAVKTAQKFLAKIEPQTVLIPWRRDPHPDHRASWQIFSRAVGNRENDCRVLEYPIWLWEMAQPEDLPFEENIRIYRLKVDAASSALKHSAIRAHVSQTTTLIDDDPQGFMLSPEVLTHFDRASEVYLEEIK